MSPRPTDAGSFAEALYEELEPLQYQEAALDYPLLKFLGALGHMFQQGEDYGRDTDAGPGWSAIVSSSRAPRIALPWLAQLVGVTIPTGLTEQQQRDWINSTDGWSRGTKAALVGAISATLTGAKTVVFRERWPDAYHLTVVTYTSQTPNPAATLVALLSQKPAGIVLTYQTLTGQDYQSLYTNHATYQNVFTSYATYQGLVTDQPGT